MITYHVTGSFVTINSGKVTLTESQAKRRSHAIKALGGCVYEVVRSIGFKRGEVFGFDGEVNKKLLQSMKTEEEVLEAEINAEEAVKASQKPAKKPAKEGK